MPNVQHLRVPVGASRSLRTLGTGFSDFVHLRLDQVSCDPVVADEELFPKPLTLPLIVDLPTPDPPGLGPA